MSGEALYTLVVVAAMVAGLACEFLQPDAVVFSALGALLVGGVLEPQEALAGFANPAVVTVGILFIVAYAAQSAGLLDYVAARVMGDGTGLRRSVLRMMAPVVGLSAFLNNTPIVAMFLPVVRDWAGRHRLPVQKFLIPLSYASIFGGLCTLIGTSTNLVVSGLWQAHSGRGLGFFELTWVGVPAALLGTAYMVTAGVRLLPSPSRDPVEAEGGQGRLYLYEMRVPAGSPLDGRTVEQAGLRRLGNVFLAEILRGEERIGPVKPGETIRSGDRLVFTGAADGAMTLEKVRGLVPSHDHDLYAEIRRRGPGRLVEAVVSRSCPLLGKTIREGGFRGRYDAVILAVHRHGEALEGGVGRVRLRPGDTLLLLAGPDFVNRWNRSREFYLLSSLSELPQLNARKTWCTGIALAGMVALAALRVVSMLEAAVLAAVFLLATRSVTPLEARRSLEINVLVVVACALGIARALEKTGAAAALGDALVGVAGRWGPTAVLAGVFVFTSVLNAFITNNAAAALAFPVAVSAAIEAGLRPEPFVIAVAVAASASFASPIAYQTNLMVYGPGGYRFRDFLKVGVPLQALYLAVTVVVVPHIWSFR
ncbi:MAG: SLC13 family permease [Candidatus Dadabacteria bacterium]|nr:MAG: SLC13 family permease [Candidatus Dadabacteria bacterium]